MAAGTLQAIWKGVSLVGRLVGLFGAGVTAYELLTREDRDLWVEQMNSFISLHGLYWGLAAASAGLILPSVAPWVKWVLGFPKWLWEIPKRQEERESNDAIVALEKLQSLLINEIRRPTGRYRGNIFENREEISILKREIIQIGFSVDVDDANHRFWHLRVSRILPYARKYGVRYAVRKFNEDADD